MPPTNTLQAWPWTVDADGEGIFFDTKAQAVAWARKALASGAVTYLDVGCMQIDLRMHPHAFRNLDEAFDPTANAAYGARYLRELPDGDAGGNWYIAIGLYPFSHAGTGGCVSGAGGSGRLRAADAGHAGAFHPAGAGGGRDIADQPATAGARAPDADGVPGGGDSRPYLPRKVRGCG